MNPSLQLLHRVESLAIAPGDFGHAGHVEAAWASLVDSGPEAGSERFCRAIKALATHHGAAGHYHHTLTIALLHIIHARRMQSATQDWSQFRQANVDLFGDVRPLLARYYSDELLRDDKSRQTFVPPDRAPLPPMKAQAISHTDDHKPPAASSHTGPNSRTERPAS